MDNGKAINLDREVPELARAVAVVRAGRGIEALAEWIVVKTVRVLACALFVLWGVGCAALAVFAGSAGYVVAAAIACANMAIIRRMARHAPSILPDDDDEADAKDPLRDVPSGFARVLILVVSATVFLPAIAVGIRWHTDAVLRRFDEKRAKADTVVGDPRWPAMGRLFAALERRNELARKGIIVESHATTVAAMIAETRNNMYLRPLGRAHLPLPNGFLKNVEDLETAMRKQSDRVD